MAGSTTSNNNSKEDDEENQLNYKNVMSKEYSENLSWSRRNCS